MPTKEERLKALAAAFTQKELPESEVELSGEIPYEDIEPLQAQALKHFSEELELPGFRKGHVPQDIVKQKVGEIAFLEEAVELFMRDFYGPLVTSRNIDAVGRPNISITKLAPGNPVGLTVRTAIYPSVPLPKNWKKLGESVEIETVPDVLDAELDEALTSIRRARVRAGAEAESSSQANASAASPSPARVDAGEGDAASATRIDPTSVIPDENLPALDDEFAKSLGAFTDLADLKQKLRDNMKQEKEQKAKESRRGKIIEALLEKVSLAIPNIFVESELDKIIGQMKEDVSRFGMTFEGYLAQVEKSEDDIRLEMREQASKRAKLQLVLNKIAEEEKIEADPAAVATELKHALEHFPDARPDLVQIHIETVLRNEEVLQLLEGSMVTPEKTVEPAAK